jgi:hypothetical protein
MIQSILIHSLIILFIMVVILTFNLWGMFENFIMFIGENIDDTLDSLARGQAPSITLITSMIAISAVIGTVWTLV